MSKIFITVIMFLLALSVLALEQKDFTYILKNSEVSPAYGITLPESSPAWDFSNIKQIHPELVKRYTNFDSEMPGYETPYKTWYHTDFAEDPFDGLIEIYVVGEPLPPATTTLLIALGILGIIKCRKLRFNKAI